MSELGQWLRETRQAKELSLEQVEVETRIRAKFLSAIEEEDFGQLPGEIYTRGFLRNYALFLGLDPEEAVEKYEQRDLDRRDGEPSLFRPLEVSLFRTTVVRLRSRLVLLILIVSVLTIGLWAWKTGRLAWSPPLALFRRRATVTASPPSTATSVVNIVETPTRSLQSSATATTEATATFTPSPMPRPTSTPGILIAPTSTFSPTPTVTPEATREHVTETSTPTATLVSQSDVGVTLAITVAGDCWTEVTLDSLSGFRGLLTAGEQRTWQAQREIILRLGNAGAVQVTVNGEFLGTLGERQQVVEFAWGPEGEVTPEPTATITATPEPTQGPGVPS